MVFFITSSDSGSLVIDTITGWRQDRRPQAPARVLGHHRSAVAIASAGRRPGRTCRPMAVSTAGLPFTLLLLAGCYAIVIGT
ncbi:MAG: hypothetical protein U5S82_05640 [Gammaproteobacteria bacterium]|nr:hypothetical protein [Gammaproteobacteria bacterium]